MDVKKKIETLQEQQPKIRRITTLDEVKRLEPSKAPPPPVKKEPGIPGVLIRLLLIGLVVFSIVGMGLVIIYRYDKLIIFRYDELNKRLHKRSVFLKDKLMRTNRELEQVGRVKDHMTKNRNSLLQAYREHNSQLNRLQSKENSYKSLLKAKASWLGMLNGDLRVATAQIEALKVQRELLMEQIKERDKRIRELRTQLLNNIGEQELLVNEVIKLREEMERSLKLLPSKK